VLEDAPTRAVDGYADLASGVTPAAPRAPARLRFVRIALDSDAAEDTCPLEDRVPERNVFQGTTEAWAGTGSCRCGDELRKELEDGEPATRSGVDQDDSGVPGRRRSRLCVAENGGLIEFTILKVPMRGYQRGVVSRSSVWPQGIRVAVALISAAVSVVLTGLLLEAATARDWSIRGWEWPELVAAVSVLVLSVAWVMALRRSSTTLESGGYVKQFADRVIRKIRREPTAEALRAAGLRLGRNTYIGRGTVFDSGFLWLISVGDDTTISARVEILVHDASIKRRLGYSVIKPVSIGSRVYIGLGAIILPGVTIGDDAIVGAGSVVRHDVQPATVVAGNPARVVNTLEAHLEKHRGWMRDHPAYSWEWTAKGGISFEKMETMREELRDGHGYVQ